MRLRSVVMMLAAASLSISPVGGAMAASSQNVARAMAPVNGVSYLQDEDDDSTGGGSTAIILGLLLVVAFAAVVTSNDPELDNVVIPISP